MFDDNGMEIKVIGEVSARVPKPFCDWKESRDII